MKEKWKQLCKTLKPMSWSQRIAHIFSCYQEAVFVAVMVILMGSIVAVGLSGRDGEVIFGGAFANTDVNRAGYSYLTDGVFSLLGGSEKQEVKLEGTRFQPVTKQSELDYNYNAAMKPIALITKGTLDYLIMDETAMGFYMTQDALMDLRDVFTDEELADLGDRLIWLLLEREQVRYPVAVDITELPFSQDCLDVSQPIYFGFTGTADNRNAYRQFWDYLNAWDNK